MAEHNPGDFRADPSAPRPFNGGGANGAAPYGQPPRATGHGHSQSTSDNGSEGLIQILSRQWHWIAIMTVGVVMLTVLYLLVAKPIYTSIATLRVAPMDLGGISSENGGSSNNLTQDFNDFLETECAVIKSNAVVGIAMEKLRDLPTLAGVKHPTDYIRQKLVAEPSKLGRTIDVSFESHSQDDSDAIVGAVVDAYQKYESQSFKNTQNDMVQALTQAAKGREEEITKVREQLRLLEQANNLAPGTDLEHSPAHMAVVSLTELQERAREEVINARDAHTQAEAAIIGNAELLAAVDAAMKHPTYTSSPQLGLEKYQNELTIQQKKLESDARSFGAGHPVIREDQSRVNDNIVGIVVAAKQWVDSAQTRLDSFTAALEVASRKEQALGPALAEYTKLQEHDQELRQITNEVDHRQGELSTKAVAGAISVSVLNLNLPGDLKPAKFKTLAIGSVVGLIMGLALACVRDWTDDRMRTAAAVRNTVGVPVLGGIPNITTAYTAADRGQIVHHEPFGIAAESYRTLRTALLYGLPANTKTLLISSPVSGDGKSTFASNLGIAFAQAAKRVLIVDADLRAPMQHRLFGLKDRVGLASVLGGGDTLEQAIQRTEIEGLDVLPCGPVPSNPSELLNSRAFTEHLHELADKYDMVLIDSPPVTAVADARILAASADVSMLVIRLETCTRKNAEAARDGLRSVGARLVGVAINGANRVIQFGGASGYYQTGTNTTPGMQSSPRRPAYDQSEDIANPSARV